MCRRKETNLPNAVNNGMLYLNIQLFNSVDESLLIRTLDSTSQKQEQQQLHVLHASFAIWFPAKRHTVWDHQQNLTQLFLCRFKCLIKYHAMKM
jgi:hypothetical protein